MRLLFFCNLVPNKPGAFEAFLTELGRQVSAGGDAMTLACAGEPIAPVAEGLRSVGVTWTVIRGWAEDKERVRPWRFCVPALRLLKEVRPDVVAVHYGDELPSFLVSTLSGLVGAGPGRWVWQQDQQIREPSWLTRRMSRIRLLAPGFDRFVAVYRGGEEGLVSRGLARGRVKLIYNGVADYTRARPAGWLRTELGLPEETVLLVHVGSLIHRKRADALLRAAARAGDAGDPGFRLLLVGDGPDRRALEALARQLGIAPRALFLGSRDDVREMLLDSDIFVLASEGEACSFAVLESMASSMPAVISNVGAAAEQVDDGCSGFVVDKDDIEGFARRLATLIAHPEMRERFGREARRRWEARHRLESMASAYHDLYRGLAEPISP